MNILEVTVIRIPIQDPKTGFVSDLPWRTCALSEYRYRILLFHKTHKGR